MKTNDFEEDTWFRYLFVNSGDNIKVRIISPTCLLFNLKFVYSEYGEPLPKK
jgi:hypothetical protein